MYLQLENDQDHTNLFFMLWGSERQNGIAWIKEVLRMTTDKELQPPQELDFILSEITEKQGLANGINEESSNRDKIQIGCHARKLQKLGTQNWKRASYSKECWTKRS